MNVGVKGDIELAFKPVLVRSNSQRLQMLPTLGRRGIDLIVRKVMAHVLIKPHHRITKLHVIQHKGLRLTKQVGRLVLCDECRAGPCVQIPRIKRAIWNEYLRARAEQRGIGFMLSMAENSMSDRRVCQP